jgi:hypothetical protein
MGLVLALMVINNFKQQTQMENKQFDITEVAIKSDGTNERGKRIIEFFEKHGVKNPGHYSGNGVDSPFYATNSRGEICHYEEIFDKTLIDLPPEQPKLPCVMEVWDNDEAKSEKFIALWINPHGKDVYPVRCVCKADEEAYENGLEYDTVGYKHCKPIPENPKRIRKMQLLEKIQQLENEVKNLRNEAEQI